MSLELSDSNRTGISIALAFLAGWTLPKVICYLYGNKTSGEGGRIPQPPGLVKRSDAKVVAKSMADQWSGHRLKMMLCVRTDLKMGKGKMCAQCGHAVAGVMEKLMRKDQKLLQLWTSHAQPKIAVKVKTEDKLLTMKAQADSLNLPNYLVADAGRTQIAAGSLTVLAIGPGPEKLIDTITKKLSLL